MQFTPYRLSPNEYGLCINADVALWLDARAYNNQPPLRQSNGFVLVTPELHSEFDSFREKVTTTEESTFPLVALLDFWNRRRAVPSSVVTMFGKQYLKLHLSEVDDLCQWVYDARDEGLELDVKMSPAITGKYGSSECESGNISVIPNNQGCSIEAEHSSSSGADHASCVDGCGGNHDVDSSIKTQDTKRLKRLATTEKHFKVWDYLQHSMQSMCNTHSLFPFDV